jgi:hypothetical protein
MEFERRCKTITAAGIKWHIRSLVPADFLNCECWPFSMVMIEDAETETGKLRKQFSGPGLKDKRIIEEDLKIKELEFQILFKGVLKPSIARIGKKKKHYEIIKAKPKVQDTLVNEIMLLSYGLDKRKDFGKFPIIIKKAFAQTIIFISKQSGTEPWLLYSGGGLASLYNPLRWDFNVTIGSYAAQLESEQVENAMKSLKGKK